MQSLMEVSAVGGRLPRKARRSMMERSVFLGLDIGSTTAKLALVAADGKLLEAQYLRHGAAVRQTLSTMLDQLALRYPGMAVSAAITGSAALGLSETLGLPFVQEVVAASRAIAVLAPQTDVAVELGGEDAKILYLSQGMDLRMNEACAGGTGAFIDQMAALLHTDASGLNELAANYTTLYPIASRCGVFAKTDVVPLLNEGAAREDLAASIFQAVVEQTAPETPAAPVVQTASALPAVSGEPGSALAKEGASVPLQAAWLLDPKGTHTLTDVLCPNAQKEFKPYEPESLPHQAGTIWMRLEVEGKSPAFPLVLDLNTRIAGQLPGIPQVWLVRPGESNGTPVRPSSDGLYSLPSPLPDQTGIYIRVNGIPAPGFAPMLRNAASLTLVDELGTQPQLVLLAVLLFLCLLRGVTERREWRMWAALYIAAVWVQAFWGLPTTPAGEVSRWDMPGLLAPGVALLILPHVGRHMLRTRHHAPFIDMQFVLLALFGIWEEAIKKHSVICWRLH